MAVGRAYFIGVWVTYCGTAFLLYRWNAVAHLNGSLHGWLFIALPLVAWAGYWHALGGSPYLRPRSVFRHCGLAVLSFGALLFSTWFWMLFALNMYGS
jgi:hypothetical protein